MRVSILIFALVAALFLGPTTGFAFTTSVDTDTQTVRVDFTGLPDYTQIRLEGVDGLSWCSGGGCDNPSSLSSTSFNANGANLEMNYEGVAPPSTNYIIYHYLDGYVFTGYQSVEWVSVEAVGAGEMRLTGNRPVLVLVPEPSTATLWFVGLALMGLTRRDTEQDGSGQAR
jgi:hypothetical protein